MRILQENNKAKWVDDNDQGRWQTIKYDKNNLPFIRKGTQIIYLSNEIKTSTVKSNPSNEVDEHSLKVYHAYWESKRVWDKMFSNIGEEDYYYYRGLCVGMNKTFFNELPS